MYVDGQRLELFNSVFIANFVDTVNSYFTDSPSQVPHCEVPCSICVMVAVRLCV